MLVKSALKALLANSGYRVFRHKYLLTGWDLTVDLKEKICLPMRTIFDVGSNIGQTGLRFAKNFPQASIYCFEPVKSTFLRLEKNVAHLPGIKVFQLALADHAGPMEIRIFDEEASVLNSLNPAAMNQNSNFTENITLTTGDRFCHENKITGIDLLKIDTEGYEIKVLQGFRQMISDSRVRAIYCEVGFNPGNKRNTFINDLMDFTRQYRFHPYGFYEISNIQLKNGNNYGNILFLSYDTIAGLPC